jgi:hypothetical protein
LLVRRSRSAVDQRRLHVVLTVAGRRRFAIVSRDAEQRYGLIERRLGRARLRALMSGLHDLAGLTPPGLEQEVAGKRGKPRVRLSRPRPRARSRR